MDIKYNPDAVGLQRIINSMRLNGTFRKPRSLYRLAQRGFFDNVEGEDCMLFVKQLDEMITRLKQNHPQSWDFNFNIEDRKLQLIIHYPHVTITNSKKQEHKIKDLFMGQTLGWSPDRKLISFQPIRATRGTLTYAEHTSSYLHSHIPGKKLDNYASTYVMAAYCTGSGEVADLILKLNTQYTPDLFDLYLQMLKTLAEWESIEGRPHAQIGNITTRHPTARTGSVGMIPSVVTKCLDNMGSDYLSHLKFYYHEDRYKVVIDETFEKVFKEYIINHCSREDWTDTLITYVINEITGNKQVKFYQAPPVIYDDPTTPLFQNGKAPTTIIYGHQIPFKIIPPSQRPERRQADDPRNYQLHPKFIRNAEEVINTRLYKTAIIRAAVRTYLEGGNQQRNIPQDASPMSADI